MKRGPTLEQIDESRLRVCLPAIAAQRARVHKVQRPILQRRSPQDHDHPLLTGSYYYFFFPLKALHLFLFSSSLYACISARRHSFLQPVCPFCTPLDPLPLIPIPFFFIQLGIMPVFANLTTFFLPRNDEQKQDVRTAVLFTSLAQQTG
jgi:hypothetical protein